MRDTNFSKGNQKMTLDIEYVTMPQNDRQQIEQIAREYESEPAKGLVHGIQKDAIQNGIGARLPGSEPNSYHDWKFTFELLKINGKYALSFWDEGTTGLTGEILTVDEIEQWSIEDRLTPDQNISRFLIRFESGGSIGPGTFGRGKLIFQAGSKTSSILCDSLRYDDNKYIAFERKIIGTRLKQTRILHQDEEAKRFIEEASGGALSPLTAPGTRITILSLKDELVEAVKRSFDEPSGDDYSELFVKMIEETWWEILNKFDAKIFVKWKDKVKQVKLSEPLISIANARDKENEWRIYKKKFLPVVVDGSTYKIKELKFVVSPNPIDEGMREIWVQRKRMKIGSASRYITPHHTIHKRLCGYVILNSDLEEFVEKSEGTTHYGFDSRKEGIRQIREIIRHHLDLFQQELGIRTESEQSRDRRDMLDTLKEINENAPELGLITDFSMGTSSKDIEISIESFKLPNKNSKRVEINQPIGPISFKIKNNTHNPQFISLYLTAEQRGDDQKEKLLHQEEIDLEPGEVRKVAVKAFQFNADDFCYSEGILIVAKVNNRNSGKIMCQVSRMVWLGREEPPSEKDLFVVTAYQPLFPRTRSRRVELMESICNIRFKISNNTAFDVKINVDLVARRSADYQVLKELITEQGALLTAMSEKEYAIEALDISNEAFGQIFEGPANADDRKCEIFFSIRFAENIPQVNKIKGDKIGKKKIDFYLGIDPPGHSIFRELREVEDAEDGRRSWYEGDRASGYIFVLNAGHPSYDFVREHGADLKRWYIREQMLIQGYAIAVAERNFAGVAEDFSEVLSAGDIPPAEAFLKMYEIIGTALLKLGG